MGVAMGVTMGSAVTVLRKAKSNTATPTPARIDRPIIVGLRRGTAACV
jgi:Fe2+ transport system protein FeoA